MKRFFFLSTALLLTTSLLAQSDSSDYYLLAGNKKVEARLYNAASKEFEKAIQLNPKNIDALIANGKVNLQMYRQYEALQSFGKAYELQPENKEVIISLMDLYYNSNQNEKAIELASKCNCEQADRITGVSYFRMENYGKALPFLKNAIKKNENDAEAAYTIARTYMELEDTKGMLEYYAKAVKADPSKAQWHYELALLYYNANDYKNSLKSFENALAAGYRRDNDFTENYGFCQLYAGNKEEGMKLLSTVMERKPNNVSLLSDVAYALYTTRQYEEATTYFEKVLTINPKDASSLYMAGMAFQKMGQTQKGQAICDKAIQMDPALAKNRQKKEMPMGL